ncbi:DNA-binding response regulator, partial [Streptomyces sp. A73]|nr:DNA-binding response regulator [Streptomyces sp. A73]
DYGPRRPAVPVYPISRRQREALLWIARGHTLAGAGREMGVTDTGVNGLLRLVYRKLGARSAAHAVALAMARGLITP